MPSDIPVSTLNCKRIIKVRNHLQEVCMEDNVDEDLQSRKKRKRHNGETSETNTKSESLASNDSNDIEHVHQRKSKKYDTDSSVNLFEDQVLERSTEAGNNVDTNGINVGKMCLEIKNLLFRVHNRLDREDVLLQRMLKDLITVRRHVKQSHSKTETSSDSESEDSVRSTTPKLQQYANIVSTQNDPISSVLPENTNDVTTEFRNDNSITILEPLTDDLVELNKLLTKGMSFARRRQIINHIKLIRLQSSTELKLAKSGLRKEISRCADDVLSFPGSNLKTMVGYGVKED